MLAPCEAWEGRKDVGTPDTFRGTLWLAHPPVRAGPSAGLGFLRARVGQPPHTRDSQHEARLLVPEIPRSLREPALFHSVGGRVETPQWPGVSGPAGSIRPGHRLHSGFPQNLGTCSSSAETFGFFGRPTGGVMVPGPPASNPCRGIEVADADRVGPQRTQ